MSLECGDYSLINNNYTTDMGKIDIDIENKYISNELVDYLILNNRYVIHIIQTNYNMLVIDNCGNIYFINSVIDYPDNPTINILPDCLIILIKNINSDIFVSFNNDIHIINIITNIISISSYFIQFKQEHIKILKLLHQKNDMIINMIDNEIINYKKKHVEEVESLQETIKLLEYENVIEYNMLSNTSDNNKNLTDTIIKLTNKNNELIDNNKDLSDKIIDLSRLNKELSNKINELIISNKLQSQLYQKEIDSYRNNFIIYFICNFWNVLHKFIEKLHMR